MRLVHLTDPHLSTLDGESLLSLKGKRWSGYLSWRKNRRKHFLPAVLNTLVDSVKAENADQILLTGDLVHIGLDTEIAEASEWLSKLGAPGQVMLVPGNHDVYSSGSAGSVCQAWSEYLIPPDQRAGSGCTLDQFPVVRKLGKLSLIGLSTACVTPVFMATGRLGEAQLRRLDGLLQQATNEGQTVVLLIHHPPLPGMTHWRKALTDAAALEAVLERHSPALIFYGHLHHNHEQQLGDARLYCTAAASSTSDASYRVIDIEDKDDHLVIRMRLKSVDIDSDGQLTFVTIDERWWPLTRG